MFPIDALLANGNLILVTDELASPADFLLHASLHSFLKRSSSSRCFILSVAEDLDKWKFVGNKSGLDFVQFLDCRRLTFIDLGDVIQRISASDDSEHLSSILRSIYDQVITKIHSECDTLIILDDISSLEWMPCVVLIRHHNVDHDEPASDDVFQHLLQLCNCHVDVRPLSSGKSGAVSGEVALHSGPSAVDGAVELMSRSEALQYRLVDTGAVYFRRGTGSVVL